MIDLNLIVGFCTLVATIYGVVVVLRINNTETLNLLATLEAEIMGTKESQNILQRISDESKPFVWFDSTIGRPVPEFENGIDHLFGKVDLILRCAKHTKAFQVTEEEKNFLGKMHDKAPLCWWIVRNFQRQEHREQVVGYQQHLQSFNQKILNIVEDKGVPFEDFFQAIEKCSVISSISGVKSSASQNDQQAA